MRFSGAARQQLDYGLSTLGKSLPWVAADTFALYFLNDVAHTPALEAGAYVLLFFFWSALCDPVVGWLLDRCLQVALPSKRYYGAGTLLFSVFFVLSFTYVGGVGSSLFLLFAGLAFRTAYAAVDVPHNALLSALGNVDEPRLGLSAMRQLSSLSATLIVTLAARPVLDASGDSSMLAYTLYAVGIAVLGAALFLGFFPTIDAGPHRSRQEELVSTAPTAGYTIPVAIAAIILTAMIGSLVAGAFSKDVVYVAKYVFGDAAWTLEALIALMIGRFLAIPIWWLAPRRIGMPLALTLAWLLLALAGATLSWLPPDRQVFAVGLLFIGIGLGGINMLGWAIIPQLACQLAQTRPAVQIRLFGLFTALTKIASGLSGLILGSLLAWSGLVDGVAPTGEQVERFYAMACFIPIPSAALGLVCVLGYFFGTRAMSSIPLGKYGSENQPA